MATIITDLLYSGPPGDPAQIREQRRRIFTPLQDATITGMTIRAHYAAEADVPREYDRDWHHPRGAPVSIGVSVAPRAYGVIARCDLEELRLSGGDIDQGTDHPYPYDLPEFDHWRTYARFRGEFEHYWWPRLLHEIDETVRRGAGTRQRFDLSLRDGMYYPHGPWTIVAHPSTAYRLEAKQTITRGKTSTPIRILEALLTTPQIHLGTAEIEYT